MLNKQKLALWFIGSYPFQPEKTPQAEMAQALARTLPLQQVMYQLMVMVLAAEPMDTRKIANMMQMAKPLVQNSMEEEKWAPFMKMMETLQTPG